MATKPVLYCDSCDKPQSEVGQILPAFFIESGQELCHGCAQAALCQMYGKLVAGTSPTTPHIHVPESKDFTEQQQKLIGEHGKVYIVQPKIPVEPGKVISYGKPVREVEIIEPVVGKVGEYFAKLVG